MKIAIISDTHLGVRNDSPIFLQYSLKFLYEIFLPYLLENKINTITHLGDMFDRRKYINYRVLHETKKFFIDELQKYGIKLILTPGNHDAFWKNSLKISSILEVFSNYEHIHIIKKPEILDFDETKILIVPWITSENSTECFSSIKKTKKVSILMGHFEISGFEMFPGQYSDDGIDKNIFKKYELVISGHFHHQSNSGNIRFVGAPYEMTFSDLDDKRGFHIFDTATRDLKFVENQSKMFRKMYYTDEGLTLDQIIPDDLSVYKDTFVKVVVQTKTNQWAFNQFMDRLRGAEPHDVAVLDYVDIGIFNEEVDNIAEGNEVQDTMTILNTHIDNLGINCNKNKIKSLMRELYTEALNNS